MANLSEQSIWETGVYQIEENDPVHGGANGITNRPTKQLANRTVWLKNELASSVQAINANLANLSTNKADKTLNLVAGNGLTGGGTLQANRTLTLGTPSQITASSTNSVTATSHTHAIDKASTTVAGVVQLVDNLTTDDATKALTANQGKALNDKIDNKDSLKTINYLADQSSNYELTGFYRANAMMMGSDALPAMEMHITHPTSPGNGNARGIGFAYGPRFDLSTTAWDAQGVYLGQKTILTELNGVMLSDLSDSIELDNAGKVATSKAVYTLNQAKLDKAANAVSASRLATARTINGVAFDGTANITITDNTKAPAVHRHNWSEIDGKPSTFAPSSHTHAWGQITGVPSSSTSNAGIVQLVDNLTADDATKALTANQGKVLNDKIDNISIGGCNLLRNTANPSYHRWSNRGVLSGTRLDISSVEESASCGIHTRSQSLSLLQDVDYVLSFDIETDFPVLDYMYLLADGGNVGMPSLRQNNGRATIRYRPSRNLDNVRVLIGAYKRIGGTYIDVRNLKLEKGTIPTDWTPAPEDKADAYHLHNWSEIEGKPSVFVPSVHAHSINDIADYDIRRINAENLNDITKWGIYGQYLNTESTSERNYPVQDEAGTLEVMPGPYGLRQRFTTFATHRQFERSRSNDQMGWNSWTELSNTWDAIRNKPSNLAYTSSNVASASRLATARTISTTGDASWSVSFDGSTNASGALTLANSGVTAGSYNAVTVDSKGRVTRGLTQVHGLITATTATGTANQATTNTNTYLNIVASGVGSTASVGSSTQVTGTNGISISSDTAGKLIISRDSNSPTATKLQTARTINGVAFDGTQNITIYDNTKLASNANAVSASRLATARTISLTGAVTGSVSFDGSGNVSIGTTLNLADFANSKTENGYQKLPNGLIIQWGKAAVPGDQYSPITFPIAFPTACLNAQATVEYGNRITGALVASAHVGGVTATGMSVGVSESGLVVLSATWLAIGY